MAAGVKRWWGLVALSLMAVGAWIVMYPAAPSSRGGRILPERLRALELREELFRDAYVYQRMEWRDSMVAELERQVSEGNPVVLGLPPEAPDSVSERLKRSVELQFRDMGLQEVAMPLGIFAIPESQGVHPAAPDVDEARLGTDEYYLARGQEAPYCVIAVSYYDGTPPPSETWLPNPIAQRIRRFAELPDNPLRHPNTLGLCRYFVQFGEAGPLIMEWLRKGASRFAELPFSADHYLLYGQGPIRGPYGRGLWRMGIVSPGVLRCLAGLRDDCRHLVMDLETDPVPLGWTTLKLQEFLADSPVDFLEVRPYAEDRIMGLAPFLFFAMQEDFGPERFGEFWRSPLDPPSAFEEAFGEPMDLWVMGWLRGYADPSPRGPGVPVQSTLLTLLALGILAGGAVGMARR